MTEHDIAITVKLIDQGATLNYGVKDLNLTLRGDGDIVLATDDGVLVVRAPGVLKMILEAAMEGIAEQRAANAGVTDRMKDIQSKIQQLRNRN